MRYQAYQKTKHTPYERTRGCRYESFLVPFGEVVTAKIADGDKLRAGKQAGQYMGQSGLCRPSGQVERALVVDDEGLHPVLNGKAHSTRQRGELPR